MENLEWIALVASALLVAYLIIGYLLHKVIFPERIPDIATYFQAGDVLRSAAEGVTQQVLRQENGLVYCTLTIEPYAPGPPRHVHLGFDERFEYFDRPISLLVGNDTIVLQPGQSYFVPRGTPHKPFNPTGQPVHLTMTDFAFPENFAFCLNQVYGYFDDTEAGKSPLQIILQMALFNQYFDSYATDGAPPVAVQRFLNFLIVPLARGLGYRSYYEKYDPRREDSRNLVSIDSMSQKA